QGFDVRVVTLAPGQDPADAAEGFEARLGSAESYVGYRVRLELERATDRQEAFVRVREVLARAEDSPERQEAMRAAADALDLPRDTLAGFAPGARATTGTLSPKVLEAGERLERDALAGCIAHPRLLRVLAELGPAHFDVEAHQRACEHLLAPGVPDESLVALLAELDARAGSEGIDEETGEQLLLHLRERRLRRELETADEAHLPDLQQALAKVRTAFREFA
nr:hypothetical protein [Solirubrobacterales bacterium]